MYKNYSTNNLNVFSIKCLCIYGTIFFLKSSENPQPLARYFTSWFSLLCECSLICLKGLVHLSVCYELFSSSVLCTSISDPPNKWKEKSIQQHYCLKNGDFHVLFTKKCYNTFLWITWFFFPLVILKAKEK